MSSTIIYTNYFATIFIFKQTILIITNIDKFNLQLICISQYFFNFNLTIRYKVEKFNIISNVLLRLSNISQSNIKNKIDVFNVFYNHYFDFSNDEFRFVILQNMSIITYYITLIKIFDDFKQKLKIVYVNDTHWIKILTVISPPDNNQTSQSQIDNQS